MNFTWDILTIKKYNWNVVLSVVFNEIFLGLYCIPLLRLFISRRKFITVSAFQFNQKTCALHLKTALVTLSVRNLHCSISSLYFHYLSNQFLVICLNKRSKKNYWIFLGNFFFSYMKLQWSPLFYFSIVLPESTFLVFVWQLLKKKIRNQYNNNKTRF